MKKVKFILIDDNIIFLKGITIYLEDILHHKVIGYAFNRNELVEQKVNLLNKADIVLMDIQMSDFNDYKTVECILGFNKIKVIAVITFQELFFLKKIIRSGFMGCILKNKVYEDLPAAIECVSRNKFYYPDIFRIQRNKNYG